MEDQEMMSLLRDMIWLEAVIATELIQVTENTSAILRNAPPPETCLAEHRALRDEALRIAEKCRPGTALRTHICGHQ